MNNNAFMRIWRKFLITAKHLVQRMQIRLRRIRSYKIPRKIDVAIKKIYHDCCTAYWHSQDSSIWDTAVDEILRRNQTEYALLFDTDDDYPESEYMDVDTIEVNKDLIAANKMLEIAEKRTLLSEKELASVSEEDVWFYSPRFLAFQKRLFTLELQVLTKYFSFGRIQGNHELIEIGSPIEARLLT